MERIEKLKKFLEQSPNDAFLTHALALEWIKINEIDEAKKCFNANLLHHPDYVATYYHLGKLYENSGDHKEAIQQYEQGLEVAKKINDQNTFRELRSALDELM